MYPLLRPPGIWWSSNWEVKQIGQQLETCGCCLLWWVSQTRVFCCCLLDELWPLLLVQCLTFSLSWQFFWSFINFVEFHFFWTHIQKPVFVPVDRCRMVAQWYFWLCISLSLSLIVMPLSVIQLDFNVPNDKVTTTSKVSKHLYNLVIYFNWQNTYILCICKLIWK